MSTSRDGPRDPQDPRDMDAEFARMLEQEGLELGPGLPPREPAATEQPPWSRPARPDRRDSPAEGPDDPWSFSADSPHEPPSPESRARSRAAHPAAGGDPAQRGGPEISDRSAPPDDHDDYLTDDEVIYGDFEPPDPDLPEPSSGALWSWTALIGGFLLMLAVTASPTLPGFLGWLGGAAAIGAVVALLLRAPRTREDENGAEV